MKKLTNLLNSILGAGNTRGASAPSPRVGAGRVWEVRQKFDTQRRPPISSPREDEKA